MSAYEKRDLMPAHDDEWACIAGVYALMEKIDPVSPNVARAMFIRRYFELVKV